MLSSKNYCLVNCTVLHQCSGWASFSQHRIIYCSMASEQLLQSLQRELAIEKAAREELERQTVLKTRQLWHLREQNDKELQQYQVCCCVAHSGLPDCCPTPVGPTR